MSARRAAEHAVRTGQHVDVELGIDFQRRKNDEIQLIDKRALFAGLAYWLALISKWFGV